MSDTYPEQPSYGIPPVTPRPKKRHRVLRIGGMIFAGFVILIIGISIGASGSKTNTVVQHDPQAPITVAPTATVTITATPSANSQGEATTISSDGVYVIGTDIASGTWHTTGGSNCYEATLSSLNTSDIIDNNIVNGPDTVNVSGAKAFDISGSCTWKHE